MANGTTKVKRPSSKTLISLFAILGSILFFYELIHSRVQNLDSETIIFIVIGGFIFLACGIGFWLMKKWAVYLFVVYTVFNQIALFLTGRWHIMSLALTAYSCKRGFQKSFKNGVMDKMRCLDTFLSIARNYSTTSELFNIK